jgi:hypothetical protein
MLLTISNILFTRWLRPALVQITTAAGGSVAGTRPVINYDGSRIAFLSGADLTGDNTDGNPEIFYYDSANGSTTQATRTNFQFHYRLYRNAHNQRRGHKDCF